LLLFQSLYDCSGIEFIPWILNIGNVMTQQFDELGWLVQRTQPNGVTTSHQYDELSQILEIEHRKSDNTVISAFNYDYDQAGNIVSVTEADSSAFKYE
jgi:YD repeat-containing protein